jgi:hypothetical protein
MSDENKSADEGKAGKQKLNTAMPGIRPVADREPKVKLVKPEEVERKPVDNN